MLMMWWTMMDWMKLKMDEWMNWIHLFIYCFMLSTFWEGSRQPCFMGDGFSNLCGEKVVCERSLLSFVIIVTKDEFFCRWNKWWMDLTHKFSRFFLFLKIVFKIFCFNLAKRSWSTHFHFVATLDWMTKWFQKLQLFVCTTLGSN